MPNNQIIMAKSSKCIEARHLRNERRKDRKEKKLKRNEIRVPSSSLLRLLLQSSVFTFATSLCPNCCSFIRRQMSQSRAHHHRQRDVCRWPWCSRCVYRFEPKPDEGKFEINKFPIGVAAFTFSVKTE